ncbi:MAG: VanZ family protein [Acutalibacteraceae bacterium]
MKSLTVKEKRLCIITLLPVLAVMITIFYFSSQTAEASTATSGGFVETAMGFITRFFGSLSSDAYQSVENTVTFIVRKAAHFLEFAALGFFLEIHLRTFLEKKTWFFSGIISLIYACSDELHQHFVSERAPRFFDVCVDFFGAFCGILLVCIIAFSAYKIKNKRMER